MNCAQSEMNKAELVTKRSFQKDDEAFIYSSWLRGLWWGNDWFHEIPIEIFYNTYHTVVERILTHPETQVSVACLREDPSVILSYCVYRDKLLHWVFTKRDWRKIGLAKDIVPKDIQTVSHLTNIGKAIKPQKVIFNPFQI